MRKGRNIFLNLFFPCFIFLLSTKQGLSQETEEQNYMFQSERFRLVGNYLTDVASFKSNWIAIDIEYSGIEPLHQFKYLKNGIWHKFHEFGSSGFSIGQLGLEYNFENKNFGIRMGVFQHLSLFSFNLVQFVYNTGQTTKGFTYRPEIGFGYWLFQLNYAYNINFNKEISVMGKHLLVFKIHFPFK